MAAISVKDLRKSFGDFDAVISVSFEVGTGEVFGFLGPNGAGKTTTLQIMVGLNRATSGEALIGNRRYDQLRHPLHEVGAVLDAGAIHPGRSALVHLACLARSNGIGTARVSAVLEQACAAWRTSGWAGSRSACASASGSPPPCSATRR